MVKIYQKRKKMDKEIVRLWSDATIRVYDIMEWSGREYFAATPPPVGLKPFYMRHELLKVG